MSENVKNYYFPNRKRTPERTIRQTYHDYQTEGALEKSKYVLFQ